MSEKSEKKAIEQLQESEKLRLLLFAVVRNSGISAMGHYLHKSEQEITDKTFEAIKGIEKAVNFEEMRAFMNLATDKENRYDRE